MSDLKIGKMVLSSCATNCYFVYHEGQNKVLVFDPGDRGDYIYSTLKANGFEVDTIFLTHGHFDHIWGCSKLRQMSSAKVYALDAEEELLSSAQMNVSEMAGRACTLKVNEFLKDGQEIEALGFKIKVLATPGHTKGSCCYYFENDGILISGDTLFEESVGRTDFPTGSASELGHSIETKLAPLPDETVVYPGHGASTTIGHERDYNPFWKE